MTSGPMAGRENGGPITTLVITMIAIQVVNRMKVSLGLRSSDSEFSLPFYRQLP